ncbi:hypothetical protein HUG10_20675 (plasmid) [Halorarum halophilum]|uniref:Uncharacterized protein n=1 Tax=Halorarum halophilum TaxID=2743090 RepID=A0A7D5L335_9EURY|nr:hypothetical protein [Halobaculum halophilum]QLG30023.1 hypothetical protein HUG10_20675 [Halobaculum halophilum]
MESEANGVSLVPQLSYNDELGGARVRSQGVNCTLTWEMFEIALTKGGIELTTDVPHQDLEALFGATLGQDCRVCVSIEPTEEDLDGE